MAAQTPASSKPFPWLLVAMAVVVFAVLLGLGNWQMDRLRWKEGLLATIHERIASPPISIDSVDARYARSGDVDYWPVEVHGTFLHEYERYFFATHEGRSGFYVYTPLRLTWGRYVFVNRGFVPYENKDPATRPMSQPTGEAVVKGLARNPVLQKPSMLVPDNDPAKNIFYWKDLNAMAGGIYLPLRSVILPFSIDADATPNEGGLPIGGVTIINFPNNHLQYAFTWFGLAAALAGVMLVWLVGRGKRTDE
ncbi:SURF1 family protein [Pseudaminobacter sp. 19-2017]|uniref:SURF1-like protein n=1 Tax=Pseudaminobacter soli (ex Zhang et al. 2022) TaxID=2831468 RepID=A0A942I8I1_9HYPH|nr:SURF1 family protein [Pseudaminobacter soli]MBS3648246.1 SURF1 family protein [Pseudaminobacter soli]